MNDRRLIEDYLPIQAISAEVSRALSRIQNPEMRLGHTEREIPTTAMAEVGPDLQ